jgi:hypothetical protein
LTGKEWIVTNPALITVEKIDAEQNAEIRRLMIDKFGLSRYIQESGAVVVASGGTAHPVAGLRGSRLLRRELRDDEPVVVIEMQNSTPEPDGSIKTYHIRVDPTAYGGRAAKDVHAAMASTWRVMGDPTKMFFKTPEDYCPRMET